MLIIVVSAVFALAAITPVLVRALGRDAGYLGAAALAGMAVWLGLSGPEVLAGDALVSELAWVPAADLSVALRLDALGLLFALIVLGIGAVVLAYAARYFGRDDARSGRYLTHHRPHIDQSHRRVIGPCQRRACCPSRRNRGHHRPRHRLRPNPHTIRNDAMIACEHDQPPRLCLRPQRPLNRPKPNGQLFQPPKTTLGLRKSVEMGGYLFRINHAAPVKNRIGPAKGPTAFS